MQGGIHPAGTDPRRATAESSSKKNTRRVARGNFTPTPSQNRTWDSRLIRLPAVPVRWRLVLVHRLLFLSELARWIGNSTTTIPSRRKATPWQGCPLAVLARYGRSSLLRIVPPLCLASVLLASRGFRLRLSLCIETTGSKVPCSSPIDARAA